MFQCIVQPKIGWTPGFSKQDLKDCFPDLRIQLQEQVKCLDIRVDTQQALTLELQDYFRRRAEVELEYSRNLDKLAKSLAIRQKELKAKKDQWHLFSVSTCWQELINQSKKESKDHAILAEVYNTQLTTRLTFISEDLQRIYKLCKEVGCEAHEELLKVLHELHTSTRTFHGYQTESKQAEVKLKTVEAQKAKLELVIPKEKIQRSKKIKLVDKEIEKRKKRFADARFKALKAKNEYILCMDAANAAVQKYFVDDLSDLIDCMDLGFYQSISSAFSICISCQEEVKKSLQSNIDCLTKCTASLDSRHDKQKFLEANNSVFMMPKKFEFQHPAVKGEDVKITESIELETSGFIRQELEQRLLQLHRRLETLRTESDELWKTLETAEQSLLNMTLGCDDDIAKFFSESNKDGLKQMETLTLKNRSDRQEIDEFHLCKFRDYMLSSNRIARLQAKYDHIRKALGDTDEGEASPALAQTLSGALQPVRKGRRKRIGQWPNAKSPRLFGGSLEEYLEATNQEIPVIIRSCIRVINRYGLHHQGIFRVSGSQVEINNFKDAFERGDDPLADVNDASDINSVAGVLKLYLRELREPLFPIVYFEQFMELADLESKHIFVLKMRDLVKSLPRPVILALRYLFAFLNHLSEFSDENMMDPFNLAICFGPTLLPVPEDKDQVQYQNLVNVLIKNVIIYSDDIFPRDGGIVYEKIISTEPDEDDVVEAPIEQSQDELDFEICPSEDESEFLEAVAQFDFCARSKRELSFKKGDIITLYSQVSGDWWRGSVNGMDGLIPDKYISPKIRDEEKGRVDLPCSAKDDFRHQRNRTASDSFLSAQTKSLSLSLSPSLNADTRNRFIQVQNSKKCLGISGESLAISTSPDSISEPLSVGKSQPEQEQEVLPPSPLNRLQLSVSDVPIFSQHDSQTSDSTELEISGTVVRTAEAASLEAGHKPRSSSLTRDRSDIDATREIAAAEDTVPHDPTNSNPRTSTSGNEPVSEPPSSPSPSTKVEKVNESISDDMALTVHFNSDCVEVLSGEPSKGFEDSTVLSQEKRNDDSFVCNDSNWKSFEIDANTASQPGSAVVVMPTFSSVLSIPLKKCNESKEGNVTDVDANKPRSRYDSSEELVEIPAMDQCKNKLRHTSHEPGKSPKILRNITFWEVQSRFKTGRTPDLVMDLPLSTSDPVVKQSGDGGDCRSDDESASVSFGERDESSSPNLERDNSSDSPATSAPASPDSIITTAAERFAKQNQCTLKKNESFKADIAQPMHRVIEKNSQNVEGSKTDQQRSCTEAQFSASQDRSVAAKHSSEVNALSQLPQFPPTQSSKKQESIACGSREVCFGKPQAKIKPQVLKKPSFPTRLIEKTESSTND